jgi:single-stranded-DNA-specific exonuclease
MEPFGPGNPEPVFLASGVTLEGCRVVGGAGARGKGHLKAIVCQDGVRFDGIGFNWGDYLPTALETKRHHVAFVPHRNEWNGQSLLQIKIKLIEPNI